MKRTANQLRSWLNSTKLAKEYFWIGNRRRTRFLYQFFRNLQSQIRERRKGDLQLESDRNPDRRTNDPNSLVRGFTVLWWKANAARQTLIILDPKPHLEFERRGALFDKLVSLIKTFHLSSVNLTSAAYLEGNRHKRVDDAAARYER